MGEEGSPWVPIQLHAAVAMLIKQDSVDSCNRLHGILPHCPDQWISCRQCLLSDLRRSGGRLLPALGVVENGSVLLACCATARSGMGGLSIKHVSIFRRQTRTAIGDSSIAVARSSKVSVVTSRRVAVIAGSRHAVLRGSRTCAVSSCRFMVSGSGCIGEQGGVLRHEASLDFICKGI